MPRVDGKTVRCIRELNNYWLAFFLGLISAFEEETMWTGVVLILTN
jgi:hypothetical protein